MVFRYPELKSDDHLYLKNYIEFQEKLQNKVDFLDVDLNVMEASARRFFSANQWPPTKTGLSDFRPSIELYFNEMGKLAQRMFHLFSRVLQEESKKFSNSVDDKPMHFYDYDTPMSTFNLGIS